MALNLSHAANFTCVKTVLRIGTRDNLLQTSVRPEQRTSTAETGNAPCGNRPQVDRQQKAYLHHIFESNPGTKTSVAHGKPLTPLFTTRGLPTTRTHTNSVHSLKLQKSTRKGNDETKRKLPCSEHPQHSNWHGPSITNQPHREETSNIRWTACRLKTTMREKVNTSQGQPQGNDSTMGAHISKHLQHWSWQLAVGTQDKDLCCS